jgi:dihydroxy-acid dehydratase
MATVIEVMGMSLPYSACTPAISPDKERECTSIGGYLRNLMEQDIKPLDIMTKAAFVNAIVMTNVLGGSTNVVLHLLAIARSAGVDLQIEEFGEIASRTPYLGNLSVRRAAPVVARELELTFLSLPAPTVRRSSHPGSTS